VCGRRSALYSLAVPDLASYRRHWRRLPTLAKQREIQFWFIREPDDEAPGGKRWERFWRHGSSW
jgi:hypothetical protein